MLSVSYTHLDRTYSGLPGFHGAPGFHLYHLCPGTRRVSHGEGPGGPGHSGHGSRDGGKEQPVGVLCKSAS